MKLHKYKVIVEHDNGVITFIVHAHTEYDARYQVVKAEGCPDSAIVTVLKVR